MVENPKLSFIAKQQTESSPSAEKSGKPKIQDNPTYQDQLLKVLQHTYSLLKKFGEVADVAEMRDQGFQLVLGHYAIDDVTKAFIQYLKTGREIPTPADIVSIIVPSTKPLCGRVYKTLINRRKEGGEFALTSKEYEYIDTYENQQIALTHQM